MNTASQSEPSELEYADSSQLRVFGEKLKNAGIGGYVEIDSLEPRVTLFCTSMPETDDLVIIQEGVVTLSYPKLLRKLCVMSQRNAGVHYSWCSESKSVGRLLASYSVGGAHL